MANALIIDSVIGGLLLAAACCVGEEQELWSVRALLLFLSVTRYRVIQTGYLCKKKACRKKRQAVVIRNGKSG